MADDTMNIVLMNPDARVPERKSEDAAGYDLFAAETVVIPARGRAQIPIGISMEIPRGYYGRIAARSGLAVNHGVVEGAGVIDADYRGQIIAVLFNHSDAAYKVDLGARVAQIIIEKIITPKICVVQQHEGATKRGEGGFGSTGMK